MSPPVRLEYQIPQRYQSKKDLWWILYVVLKSEPLSRHMPRANSSITVVEMACLLIILTPSWALPQILKRPHVAGRAYIMRTIGLWLFRHSETHKQGSSLCFIFHGFL